MKNILNFKSIKSKLLAAFSIVIILVIGMGIYNFISIKAVNNNTENILNEELQLMIANQQLEVSISNRISTARGYILEGDPVYKDLFAEYTEKGKQAEKNARDIGVSEDFNQLMQKTIEWRTAVDTDVFQVYEAGNEELARKNLEKLNTLVRELMDGYSNLADDSLHSINVKGKHVISTGASTMTIITVVTIVVVLMSILAAFFTSNIITKPIVTVMQRMKLIAAGDLSHEPMETSSRDEVGQLVLATNEMSHNTRELLTQINKVSESVTAQSEELTQSSNEVNAASSQIAITMQELASGIEGEAKSAGELATIMETFSIKVEEANEKGEQIQNSSDEVLSMTLEGSHLMEMSSEQMVKIDQIVQDAVGKIQGLDEQSQKISKLVVVIKTIADQTNLLALNAAIEAARAGEHGKGFAVVAEEVKKLAEQVSVSVTDITDIVKSIQQESSSVAQSLLVGYEEVEKGTNQIKVTGQTFHAIDQAVTDMATHIKVVSGNLANIAASTQEMSGSVEEIAAISEQSSAGVEQTSASSQQTSSSMEEVAGSAVQLSRLAEELNGLVLQFKL